MNRLLTVLCLISLGLTSCIKNDPIVFTGAQVEWDATSWNPNTAPFAFPIMTRVPAYDNATTTAAPFITRTTGQVVLRVNLIGAQRATPTAFTYQVAGDAVPANLGQAAVSGTHYGSIGSTGTIPANSSFGFVTVPILNPGAPAPGSPVQPARVLILELTSMDNGKPAVNYAKIGLSINQN